MKQEIINGGNARYLGELERFKDGIPFGIVNKTKTDVGGTYVEMCIRDSLYTEDVPSGNPMNET